MNTEGALGQGDTDPRLQPRLLERLKGVKIERAFAFNGRSYAIDQAGVLYGWGKGFGLFPEPLKFGDDEDFQSIVQVTMAHSWTDFGHLVAREPTFSESTVFYLNRLGEVFWSDDNHPTPMKLLATYDHFVVQIAAGGGHLLVLTADGEVYGLYLHPIHHQPLAYPP